VYYDFSGCEVWRLTIPAKLVNDETVKDYDQWFVECTLTNGKTEVAAAKDFDPSDPWIFPVNFKVAVKKTRPIKSVFASKPAQEIPVISLYRPGDENGELPNWKWLKQTFGDSHGYPSPNHVLMGNAKKYYEQWVKAEKERKAQEDAVLDFEHGID
jgi:hypothetical protein